MMVTTIIAKFGKEEILYVEHVTPHIRGGGGLFSEFKNIFKTLQKLEAESKSAENKKLRERELTPGIYTSSIKKT